MVNTIIFDLDGTLLYTLEDLKNATNHALGLHGYSTRTVDEVRSFVGNGIRVLVEKAVPDEVKVLKGTEADKEYNEIIDEIFEELKAYYSIHSMDNTGPYPGVVDLVKKLKEAGYKLAIVSNKVDFAVKELRDEFFADVEVAIGERDGIARKPARDMVDIALRELGSSKNESVYIGDSEVDLATAKNSELPCISVLWGFRDKDILIENGGNCFAETAMDVFDIIQNM